MATATMTHRLTMPKNMSMLLSRRAKAENTTLSQAFVRMMKDARLYAEEGHIWELALERERTSNGEYIEHDEFWKLAAEIPYVPGP